MDSSEEIKKEDLPEIELEQHKLFIKHYCILMNATKSAISSGYSKKSARQQGSELLRDPYISVHIEYFLQEKHKKLDIKAEDVIRELAGIGFSRMTDFVERDSNEEIDRQLDELDPDDFGSVREYKKEVDRIRGSLRLKSFDDMGESVAAIDEISVSGTGITDIKTKGKIKSLELIGKHIGMWNYEPETSGRNRESNLERIREAIRRSGGERRVRAERKGDKGNSGELE